MGFVAFNLLCVYKHIQTENTTVHRIVIMTFYVTAVLVIVTCLLFCLVCCIIYAYI